MTIALVYAGYAFGLVFVVCELCQRASYFFIEINSSIDILDWYLFPINVQKIMPTLLIMAQQPVEIECFGSIVCDRDTFKRVSSIALMKLFSLPLYSCWHQFAFFQVINQGYSSFMLLSNFSNWWVWAFDFTAGRITNFDREFIFEICILNTHRKEK